MLFLMVSLRNLNRNLLLTLGKSCGAGLANISIAGAGFGVYTFIRNMKLSTAQIRNTGIAQVNCSKIGDFGVLVFKRSMHRMNFNSFINARQSFLNYSLARSQHRSMTSQVLLKDSCTDETLVQNQKNNPWAFLDNEKPYKSHWYIAEVPRCSNGCEKDNPMFSGYDKLMCAFNTKNCALLVEQTKICIIGLNTHDGTQRWENHIPIYEKHLKSANVYDVTIFKRLAKFIISNAYTGHGFDHQGLPKSQYVEPLEDHIKLIIPLEQAVCMELFDSKLLASSENTRINQLIHYFRELNILPPKL